jgi:predicted enzyme related to lactoylglutathione lyase
MSEHKYTPGRIVWRELVTDDREKAKRYYGELLNWKFEAVPMGPAGEYTMIKVGDKAIGGLMEKHAEMKAMNLPSHWMSYVSVDDVDAAANAAKASGGKVLHGPSDIPNVGRFAVLADGDGAAITAFRSAMGDPTTGRPGLSEFCWETLSTKDIDRASAFYGKVFGWKATTFQGMTTFGVGEGMENQVADAQLAEGPVPPNWLTFAVVEKNDTATARAGKLGGQVMMPAMDIPNIGRISVITDDQGAAIGLFQPSM